MSGKILSALGLTFVALALPACIADDSAPSLPRTRADALQGGPRARENAEHRELEAPKRELPTSGGEFPGQSRLDPPSSPSIALLQASPGGGAAAAGAAAGGAGAGAGAAAAETPGGATPAPGAQPGAGQGGQAMAGPTGLNDSRPFALGGAVMAVPGTSEVIPAEWGQVAPLPDYPHRPWNPGSTQYLSGAVPHNPVYWSNLFERQLESPNTAPSSPALYYLQDYAEAPWFFVQSFAVPFMMLLNPPLNLNYTAWPARDAVYHGYLPPTGPVHPAPVPGEIRWTYPFTTNEPGGMGPVQVPPPPENK